MSWCMAELWKVTPLHGQGARRLCPAAPRVMTLPDTVGRLTSNQPSHGARKLPFSNVDPQDIFRHPWEWQEISRETAHLRCCFAPVVVVWNASTMHAAELLSPSWSISNACTVSAFQPRFFTQVGTGRATTAVSPVAHTMAISMKAVDFIGRGYENPAEKGYDKKTARYFPYDDHYGFPTIGYGHKIKSGEDFSKGLTVDQVRNLLATDLDTVVQGVNKQLKVGVSHNQFDAIVSLDFNVGLLSRAPGWTPKHHIFNARKPVEALNHGKAVREEDFTIYAKAHDKHHGNKVVFVKGLLTRRKAEWKIFSKNVYDSRH